ncbi:ricin-type beta-trefoil lectin domain protein [Streptomyces actinomycinicus]|uniref:Ricin-type beta-trefoil lectin domain protein n=1 Tax=Streptomyces actinomycinicus TaxID=1695166 RepID=A0A937EL69_9ACTN|nr:RICIN domain-containing protein [Streptomyces actinomycinicus]MBL1084437.1 ricin-type beta-trefoil lectin domain protein [Streptomyces actinomycinicus]
MHEAGLSDEQLSAALKKWTGTSPALHPVGELLDRHWAAAFAYARLCTDGPRAAGMLTTAAFTRLFGAALRQSGPTAAWRPHVLIAVRRIAAEWDTDGRRELLHPALRSDDGTGERASAKLLPPPGRRQLSRAFQRVPETSRAVLWHVEVEAEPLAVPAALLGLEEEDVRVELRRARERLREECLQVHREMAPEDECQRYLRMLDVTFRRGGTDIDPDLGTHLARCGHCSGTADQLARFNDGLGLALAEAVLGWGAHGYVASRAARAEDPAAPVPAAAAVAPMGGDGGVPGGRPAGESWDGYAVEPVGGEAFMTAVEPGTAAGRGAPADGAAPAGRGAPSDATASPGRGVSPGRGASDGRGVSDGRGRSARRGGPAARRRAGGSAAPGENAAAPGSAEGAGPGPSRRSLHRAARRARRRNLSLAVLTVSGLVVLPLVLWSVRGSGDSPAPGAAGSPTRAPGKPTPSPSMSWAATDGRGQGALRGRLHNLASGLCVDVVGGKTVEGAETELADCSASPRQQWRYETDGLLRSSAAPDLCLDSRLGYSVRLAPCAATGDAALGIRYDFTTQGALVPRWNQDLALTPAATDGSGALVLKTRAPGTAQRWTVDTAHADLRMANVNWDSDSTSVPSRTTRPGTTAPATPTPSGTRKAGPKPTATTPGPTPTPTAGTAGPCAAYPQYCDGNGGDGGYGGGHHHR